MSKLDPIDGQNDRVSGLATEMLTFLLGVTHEQGFVAIEPFDVSTHHLLLVLAEWGPNPFQPVIDRAVSWFSELKDDRDSDEKDLNPFRLMAMMALKRPDAELYVQQKITALKQYHKKADGHVVLQIGAGQKLANELQDVFPTMMAAHALIDHGTSDSLAVAHDCLSWTRSQFEKNSVHKNAASNAGFAALLASRFQIVSNSSEFSGWRDALIEMMLRDQSLGFWCDDPVQNAYVFHDLALIFRAEDREDVVPAIRAYLGRILSEPQLIQVNDAQSRVLIFSTILRAVAALLPNIVKEHVRLATVDQCIQRAGVLFWHEENLIVERKIARKIINDFQRKQLIPVNPSIFTTRDFEFKPKQVFLLTPFGHKTWGRKTTQFGQLAWREEGYDFDGPRRRLIEPVVESLGYSCIEADSQFAPRDFMEKIWQQINESVLVIADLTSGNPNVMYEAGIAHTLGKPVVFITQDGDYVPTDLRRIEYVRYDAALGREEEFKDRLARALKHALGLR